MNSHLDALQQVAPQPPLVSPTSQNPIVVLVPVNEELSSLKKANQFFREENLLLQKRVDRLEENQNQKKQLEEHKIEIENLHKENTCLREDNQNLKARLDAVEDELDTVKKHLNTIEKKLNDLRKE